MQYDETIKRWIHVGPSEKMDRYIAEEVQRSYRHLFQHCHDKIVLDVGANIGMSTVLFAKTAGQVVAVEPEPTNFSILTKNTEDLHNVRLINAGVGQTDGTLPLYVLDGANAGTHTMIKKRGRRSIDVPVICFDSLLAEVRPDILKFDAEGAEQIVASTLRNLPSYVKLIAIEFDIRRKNMEAAGFGCDAGQHLFDDVKSQFRSVKERTPAIKPGFDHLRNWLFVGER